MNAAPGIRRCLGLLLGSLVLPILGAAPGPTKPVREGDMIRFGRVTVNPITRTVSVPGRLEMTRGLLEYLLVTDYGKTHESLLITEASAYDLHAALLLLNVRAAGTNLVANSAARVPAASALDLEAEWVADGRRNLRPIHELVALAEAGDRHSPTGHLAPGPWIFLGSFLSPEGFAAHFEGSLVTLIHDPTAIVGNPRPEAADDDIHVPETGRLPTNGTPVTLHFRPHPPARSR
jgi:hypothetical protein